MGYFTGEELDRVGELLFLERLERGDRSEGLGEEGQEFGVA